MNKLFTTLGTYYGNSKTEQWIDIDTSVVYMLFPEYEIFMAPLIDCMRKFVEEIGFPNTIQGTDTSVNVHHSTR